MREYQQKHMIRTLLYSRVTMIVLFILCILLLRSVVELNNKRIEVSKLRDEASKDKEIVAEKVAKATKQSDGIATPRCFDSYVRNTYPVVKEGEGVIVIYDQDKSPVSQVRADMNIWERLLIFWNTSVKR